MVDVVMSSDGNMIFALSAGGTLHTWSYQNDTWNFDPICGEQKDIISIALSGNRQTLVTGSKHGAVGVWRFEP